VKAASERPMMKTVGAWVTLTYLLGVSRGASYFSGCNICRQETDMRIGTYCFRVAAPMPLVAPTNTATCGLSTSLKVVFEARTALIPTMTVGLTRGVI
jgi:hypothetical protein